MQIVENKHLIPGVLGNETAEIQSNCQRWRAWQSNPMNLWDWRQPKEFQDDSGV